MSLPIEIKGLSISYQSKRVLTNIFLNIHPGRIYGLVGPNGAGKSTLFKAILGLIEPDVGQVTVFGEALKRHPEHIAYVPQKDEIDWDFPATVEQIVRMGRYPFKKLFQGFNRADSEFVKEALRKMDLTDLKNRQIGKLSGGQQQRVFIARALCQNAEIYLLDEPFVGVDMVTENTIVDTLRELRGQGKTAVVVHHDLNTLEDYFDHTILLNQRMIAHGPTREVFTQENLSKAYGPQLNILNKTKFR